MQKNAVAVVDHLRESLMAIMELADEIVDAEENGGTSDAAIEEYVSRKLSVEYSSQDVVDALQSIAGYKKMVEERKKQMTTRINVLERIEATVKSQTLSVMTAMDVKKLTTPHGGSLTMCQNSVGRIVQPFEEVTIKGTLVPEDHPLSEYVTVMNVPVLNTEKLKRDLAEGVVVPDAMYVRGHHLRTKVV